MNIDFTEETITIESIGICPENINEYERFGMMKSDGSFLSIKEQYDNRSDTSNPLMTGFIMRTNETMCTAAWERSWRS